MVKINIYKYVVFEEEQDFKLVFTCAHTYTHTYAHTYAHAQTHTHTHLPRSDNDELHLGARYGHINPPPVP